jgi:predicted transcriptional regulator
MTLIEIVERLELTLLNPQVALNEAKEVRSAHASDLLSDVLANAPSEGLLLTIQVHMNVVAVALHANLNGVVFTAGMSPEEAVLAKATSEGLPLLGTRESTFDTAGRMYALGLRGRHG